MALHSCLELIFLVISYCNMICLSFFMTPLRKIKKCHLKITIYQKVVNLCLSFFLFPVPALRRDDSSIDSLECSPPPRKDKISLSRDSGLTMSDSQLYTPDEEESSSSSSGYDPAFDQHAKVCTSSHSNELFSSFLRSRKQEISIFITKNSVR